MTTRTDYGLSPRKAKRKSCLNCAYFVKREHSYSFYVTDYQWLGESGRCFHKVWNGGFSSGWLEVNEDSLDQDVMFDGGEESYTYLPITERKAKELYGPDYGRTRIPTKLDDFIEAASYRCRRFYPAAKLNTRELGKCWEDQKVAKAARDGWIKFWLPMGVSLLAFCLSAVSLWKTWK